MEYAASKMVDEFLTFAYYKEKQVPVIIIRLFNTVGPRQTGRYGMVIPRFVDQALVGQPITVYGDGQQTRTFLHVKDAVYAMMKIVENQKAWGEIFNIGGNNEISVLSLAKMVKKTLNSGSEIIFTPYEQAYEEGFEDMRRRRPDISKIKKLISFNPKFSLQDVIADVADYQREKGL